MSPPPEGAQTAQYFVNTAPELYTSTAPPSTAASLRRQSRLVGLSRAARVAPFFPHSPPRRRTVTIRGRGAVVGAGQSWGGDLAGFS